MKKQIRKIIAIGLSILACSLSCSCSNILQDIDAAQVITTVETIQDTANILKQNNQTQEKTDAHNTSQIPVSEFDYSSIPTYTGEPYYVVNNHQPFFDKNEITAEPFEKYGELDNLGRCTAAIACVGKETMPAVGEERGNISSVKPTGWVQNKYDCVEGGWVINRSHMIMWALSAENANEKNLVTGTRYMNLEMLEYENLMVDYIRETGNHVLYRVTPIFVDDELMCRGLLMEAQSVEDDGEGIQFCIFMYNVQPGIEFDYKTGNNWYTGEFLDTDSLAVHMK